MLNKTTPEREPFLGQFYYTLVDTILGWMGLLGSSAGLRRIVLPQPSPESARASLTQYSTKASPEASPFGDLPQRLRQFLEGKAVDFPDKLDFANSTPFQQAVWQVTHAIPYGETRSYACIARQTGKPHAARAVGQAMARNPLPIIVPCHRVIASSGNLQGFGGGLEMKRYLLEMEARVQQAR